jgi:GNAT superfamily N-acetyltransferase
MTSALQIRLLEPQDVQPIADAFEAISWSKPASLYRRYLAQQSEGRRTALVAFKDGAFAGYLTINWQSDYPPFREAGIPEIQDFNVLPRLRRQGIGSALMDEAERRIAQRSAIIGIGVGLYADYGPAQRLYALRGYLPDGRGLIYQNQVMVPGSQVTVDDDLVLYLTKQAPPAE